MSLEQRVKAVFAEILDVGLDFDFASLKYNDHPSWTSLAHMSIVAGLETEFDIILEMDDILAMSDFAKAVEIVSRHHAPD
jgi:acyl carrier protein